MQIALKKDGGTARIVLNGRFDFSSHRDFRVACDEASQMPGLKEIEVDFLAVEYLDSSALGMLLLLRDKAAAAHAGVSLLHCQGIVQQVLLVANFQNLFSIR